MEDQGADLHKLCKVANMGNQKQWDVTSEFQGKLTKYPVKQSSKGEGTKRYFQLRSYDSNASFFRRLMQDFSPLTLWSKLRKK
jgi:hypothetical protein